MLLKRFRVRNFRSIDDSGVVEASRITALLGRNESGKSNILRALHSLNPSEGFTTLNAIRNFPRNRDLKECVDETPVVESAWELSKDEKSNIMAIWPRAKNLGEVTITRNYGKIRGVGLHLGNFPFDKKATEVNVRKISFSLKLLIPSADQSVKEKIQNAIAALSKGLPAFPSPVDWANSVALSLRSLQESFSGGNIELNETNTKIVAMLEEQADNILKDNEEQKNARKWLIENMPKFIFLDDCPEIAGHQDIAAFLQRKTSNTATDADRNFEKLCKVSGLEPERLNELLQSNDQETRTQLANRAGATVTKAIRRRWKDRPLKVRFNLDANEFEILIADPNTVYDVEVNLDERSRGFKWFFAFYIVFSADKDGGNADNAILLLDEPGLYLHAKSQGDLLRHLEDDFTNQIIYTTHSPFMVPTDHLSSVRTVTISEDGGTAVSNDPAGDAHTLFPLQAALGYDLAQSLFIGPNNLIVEGVTDFWILSSVSEHLNSLGSFGLHRDLVITPAGGAQKIHYMVALLTSERLNVIVLFDDEKEAKKTRDDLVRGKLIRDESVIFTSSAFEPSAAPSESDIEDILDANIYEGLVIESYAKELKGKTLSLNKNLPRIAKRMEVAFREIDIEFHKTRPAKLFLRKMADNPGLVMPEETVERFRRIFSSIKIALVKHKKKLKELG